MTDLDPEARAETVRMIADSAAFLASADQLARARHLRWQGIGFARDLWGQAAELGWLGLRTPEDRGGVGLGMSELCALCERLGGGLAPEPLPEAIVVAPLLDDGLLGAVLSGERIVLPAWQDGEDGATRLKDGRLYGRKRLVRMGRGADALLVAVGQGSAVVDVQADGVSLTEARLQDGGHFATVELDGAPGRPIPASIDGGIVDELALATAAYLLGLMRRAFEITKDYLVTRRQFGQAIGSFQVLQHRMVDLYTQIELAAAAVAQAAALLDAKGDAVLRRRAVSRAKARASDAAMLVTRQGVQLHGGIGFMDEADIGLYLRKALVLSNLYGSPQAHRRQYAASLTWAAGVAA